MIQETSEAPEEPLYKGDRLSLIRDIENAVWRPEVLRDLLMRDGGEAFLREHPTLLSSLSDQAIRTAVVSYCQDRATRQADGRLSLIKLLLDCAEKHEKMVVYDAFKDVLRRPREKDDKNTETVLINLVRKFPLCFAQDGEFLNLWVGDGRDGFAFFRQSFGGCLSYANDLPFSDKAFLPEAKNLVRSPEMQKRRAGVEALRQLSTQYRKWRYMDLRPTWLADRCFSILDQSQYSDVRAQLPGMRVDVFEAEKNWIAESSSRPPLFAKDCLDEIRSINDGEGWAVTLAKLQALQRMEKHCEGRTVWREGDVLAAVSMAQRPEDAADALPLLLHLASSCPHLFSKGCGKVILGQAVNEAKAKTLPEGMPWTEIWHTLAEEQGRGLNPALLSLVMEESVLGEDRMRRGVADAFLIRVPDSQRNNLAWAIAKFGFTTRRVDKMEEIQALLGWCKPRGLYTFFVKIGLGLRKLTV